MGEKQDYLFEYRQEQVREFTVKASSLKDAESKVAEHFENGVLPANATIESETSVLKCIEEPKTVLDRIVEAIEEDEYE